MRYTRLSMLYLEQQLRKPRFRTLVLHDGSALAESRRDRHRRTSNLAVTRSSRSKSPSCPTTARERTVEAVTGGLAQERARRMRALSKTSRSTAIEIEIAAPRLRRTRRRADSAALQSRGARGARRPRPSSTPARLAPKTTSSAISAAAADAHADCGGPAAPSNGASAP